MSKIVICGHGKIPKSLLESISKREGLDDIEIVQSMKEIESQTSEKGIPVIDLDQLKYKRPTAPLEHKKGRRGRKRRKIKYF